MIDIEHQFSQSLQHSGIRIPRFFYGTAWKEERTEVLTYNALVAGFKAIDTANQRRHYFEEGVGNAVKRALGEQVIQRDELFLQSKFTFVASQDHRLPYDANANFSSQVQQSFASSLEHLHTDYLDSYVLHGPSSRQGLTDADWEVWQAMEALYKQGAVKLLGISNVSHTQLQTLINQAEIPPAFVQNRCFAYSQWDVQIRDLCQQHNILYQGFSLLTANARELQKPEITQIAQRLACTIPQLIFRFAMQIGMIPLTGTSSIAHLNDDLASMALPELTPADMAEIEGICL